MADLRPAQGLNVATRSEGRFAPRVHVFSPGGDYVYTVHAEEAARMVQTGQAKCRGKMRRTAHIELTWSLAQHRRKPCTPPSLSHYMGQKYTYREALKEGGDVVAYVTQFKYIDPRDRPLFLLAIEDCRSRKPHGADLSRR